MRTRKIYLTNQEKPMIVRNSYQRREIGVGHVNWAWFPFFAGVVLAIAVPFLIDWALFGTPTPCQTEKTFNDGSSLQMCRVEK